VPRIKLTKTAIDDLPTPKSDLVYWDAALPGFGVKITPKGRKVFIVLYRMGGAGSNLRKYTIGPFGRVTLHQARVAAQKVFAARLDGRDPAAEKRESKRRIVVDRFDLLLEEFIAQRLVQKRSGTEIARVLRREFGQQWAGSSIHGIKKRDVVDVVSAIEQRGAPAAAIKALKSIKTFFSWAVGRAVLDQSPAAGVPLPAKAVSRDRVLTDKELAKVILAARLMSKPYGSIVEFLPAKVTVSEPGQPGDPVRHRQAGILQPGMRTFDRYDVPLRIEAEPLDGDLNQAVDSGIQSRRFRIDDCGDSLTRAFQPKVFDRVHRGELAQHPVPRDSLKQLRKLLAIEHRRAVAQEGK